MSGFPSLKPAMTLRLAVDPSFPVGSISRGTPLTVIPMTRGTLKSEPGFEPAVDMELLGAGSDYIRSDPAGGHMRLDARAQLKSAHGELLAMYYKGPVAVSDGVKKILSGASDAKTTDYGDSFVTIEFETGSEKYKSLESTVFAAAGHFVIEDGAVSVEYKLSQVVKS